MHDYVVTRLIACPRDQWPEVAESAGVALGTLRKIAWRQIKDPGVSHIQKLAEYFLLRDAVTASAGREKSA
jgi:hypothetical protein